jgi:hypothetical protein
VAVEAEFKQLEEEDIIQRSTSPLSSPLHMMRKADGSWRPCRDFRQLNLVTEPDVYPLPNMLDFAPKMAGCIFISKINLRKGYQQIPVNPEDVHKTAITTPLRPVRVQAGALWPEKCRAVIQAPNTGPSGTARQLLHGWTT